MWLEYEQFMSREPLKALEEKEKFLNAQDMQETPMQAFSLLQPDPMKLETFGYKTLLDNGWCVVSWRGVIGGGKSSYEFKPRSYEAQDEKYTKFAPESGHATIPSYLRLRWLKVGQEAGKGLVYLFRDTDMQNPIAQPLPLQISF